MEFRRAGPSDLPVLAELNHQLIRDEGHRNQMTVSELEGRMQAWLDGEYQAHVFQLDTSIVGYALYREDDDSVYIRQFFIRPDFRRQGHGRRAFEWLAKHVWTNRIMRLDVLVGNHVGIAFWRSLGFDDYCITMELDEGPGYVVRDATEQDEQFMRTLHERCYRDVVFAQFGEWNDEQQRGFFDRKWNPSNYQIIVVGRVSVGGVSVRDEDDHVCLSEIVIDPDFQNQGLGTNVVENIVNRAKSENRPVRLQVLRANRAHKLYVRLGFKEIGRTDTHIRMEI